MTTISVLFCFSSSYNVAFRQLSVCGDLIAVLDAATGAIHRIRYGGLDALMRLAFRLELFDYCADILLQRRRLIRNLSPAALQSIAALGALPRKLTDFNKESGHFLSAVQVASFDFHAF
jgi:hypothetical protein